MSPIPFTLVGIVPGHWLLHAFFTATSMIGFIALAGIILRNSILLIEFTEQKIKEGYHIEEALLEAGIVRTRPILLTAAAVIVGAFVIIFDPIFNGLAISLIFGTFASTTLTLVVVPLLYYMMEQERALKMMPAVPLEHPEYVELTPEEKIEVLEKKLKELEEKMAGKAERGESHEDVQKIKEELSKAKEKLEEQKSEETNKEDKLDTDKGAEGESPKDKQ
jgi:hypothetical protein